jgi:hypothetical protein
MLLPALLLQKPAAKSKNSEHKAKLEERLKQWDTREIDILVKEGKLIQKRLVASKIKKQEDNARTFANLMFHGKVTAAMRFLTNCDDQKGGLVEMNDATIKELKMKHPPPAPLVEETLLFGPIEDVPVSYFDCINEDLIHRAANYTRGSCGPSHMDADHFRFLLTSKYFKHAGTNLRTQIAKLARILATRHVDPAYLESYVCSRLIPLNKNPGIRPIGVGEVLRRIIGKSLSWTLKPDIQDAAGCLQVSSGVKSGGEAAIHFMREAFDTADAAEAVILVDASNAFNSLNRSALLHNIQVLCPPISKIAINMYRTPARLIITGGGEIASAEGTTQGDNLAMSLYALGTVPILNKLRKHTGIKQIWLADDATSTGNLTDLKSWWDDIVVEGQKYGYFVHSGKSWLILKDPKLLQEAEGIFNSTKISITTDGSRHLGAVLGSVEFRQQYINDLVKEWTKQLSNLVEFAKSQPHAAYAAYTHGFKHKFTYFLRTIPEIVDLLYPIDDMITEHFIPTLFGCPISELERKIIALPVKYGGLGIQMLADLAPFEFQASTTVTRPLVDEMHKQNGEVPGDIEVAIKRLLDPILESKDKAYQEKLLLLETSCSNQQKRLLVQAQEKGASSWLNVLPLIEHGFVMNKSEFRDAVCIRYGKTIKNLPPKCACGHEYNITHALNCHRGGFVIMRHNEIRDFEANLLKKVCTDVEIEPPLQQISNEVVTGLSADGCHPDIRARGFWRKAQNAFFDVQISNINSDSYKQLPPKKVYERLEREKRRRYNNRVMNIEHGTFTALIFSISGGMGSESLSFHKALANKIAMKTNDKYCNVINFIRCKLSFLIQKLALLCVRGSRSLKRGSSDVPTDIDFACFESKLSS